MGEDRDHTRCDHEVLSGQKDRFLMQQIPGVAAVHAGNVGGEIPVDRPGQAGRERKEGPGARKSAGLSLAELGLSDAGQQKTGLR